MSTETIAAIATALGSNAVSIIRISGLDSLNIIKKIFRTTHNLEHSKIVLGNIVDNVDNKVLDQVLVSFFQEPKSYTGENVIEVNCHGGRKVTLDVLQLILKNGARLAQPGEFTKRAFLNGKLDLSQAEAIMDLINSKTIKQTRIANEQLEGKLSKEINEVLDILLTLMASIEVSVDYPEYDYEEIENDNIIKILNRVNMRISNLLCSYNEGRIIKDGINVAIIGKPNVGKSSLLNKLSNYERAIVTDIAGTTRDIIEETINIDDIVLNIADTAGIRDTNDIVEKIGVDKAIELLDKSDLIIYMIDSNKNIDNDDIKVINNLDNKNCIVIINKIDISDENNIINLENNIRKLLNNKEINIIKMSIEKEIGVDILKKAILDLYNVGNLDMDNPVIITNERHKELLEKCKSGIIHAVETVDNNMPIEIITTEIKNAVDNLGEILGKNISDEVISKIFEKFCLGK